MLSPSPLTDERAYVQSLINHLVQECPRRFPTSIDERHAQEIMRREFHRLGLHTNFESFRFNVSLYANLALHSGLALLATVLVIWAPFLALALHLLVGLSLFLDTTRRGYLLRRLFPFYSSQNLIATLPAQGLAKLRIVLAAHADAAPYGWLFHPQLVKRAVKTRLPFSLERTLAVITYGQLVLAMGDLAQVWLPHWALFWWIARALILLPLLITLVFNLQVVARNQVVPGANDDLSAVAMLPVLAARLRSKKPKDVELVFVVTGCEEASMGGATALAWSKRRAWSKESTVFIALDCMTNGHLSYLGAEGDVVRVPIDSRLEEMIRRSSAQMHGEGQPMKRLILPAGGTDAHSFLAHGYRACSLVCVHPELGTPMHYHQPSDTPDNLDVDTLMKSVAFVERLVHTIDEYGEMTWAKKTSASGR